MRLLRAMFDLPWWMGFPIFLVGSSIVPHWNIFGFIVGLLISLFGCWVFSKLLHTDEEYKDVASSALCLLLFILCMCIPYRYEFINPWIAFMNSIPPTILYATRSGLGLFFGFLTFARGFRK